jgi:hypothetical protein
MKKNFLIVIAILQVSFFVNAQTTAQWRGLERNGIYPEKNLLKKWPANGPQMLWSYEGIGNGYGSPTITSDKLYITGEIDSIGYLFAFDLKGKLL